MADHQGGRLTTHVLDTARGRPASGLGLTLYWLGAEGRTLIASAVTNSDGRCDAPLLEGDSFALGSYELVFEAGDYLRQTGAVLSEPPFLDRIPIRFGIAEQRHYHVPLLLSPYGYATYRGS